MSRVDDLRELLSRVLECAGSFDVRMFGTDLVDAPKAVADLLAVLDAVPVVLAYIEQLEQIAYDEVFDPSPHEMVAPFAAAMARFNQEEGKP